LLCVGLWIGNPCCLWIEQYSLSRPVPPSPQHSLTKAWSPTKRPFALTVTAQKDQCTGYNDCTTRIKSSIATRILKVRNKGKLSKCTVESTSNLHGVRQGFGGLVKLDVTAGATYTARMSRPGAAHLLLLFLQLLWCRNSSCYICCFDFSRTVSNPVFKKVLGG
jgi:hypothetical protein